MGKTGTFKPVFMQYVANDKHPPTTSIYLQVLTLVQKQRQSNWMDTLVCLKVKYWSQKLQRMNLKVLFQEQGLGMTQQIIKEGLLISIYLLGIDGRYLVSLLQFPHYRKQVCSCSQLLNMWDKHVGFGRARLSVDRPQKSKFFNDNHS